MTESQFGPRDGEADDQTRVSYPHPAGSQGQAAPSAPQAPPAGPPPTAAQQQSHYPPPQAQPAQAQPGFAPYQGGPYGQGQQQAYRPAAQQPRRSAGYFRSLFDLSYDNLGAAKFARVFQLLFMIVTGLATLILIARTLQFGSFIPLLLGIVVGPLVWLLLNTLVRLILEAVVGIVQTAENSEEMLSILRERDRA